MCIISRRLTEVRHNVADETELVQAKPGEEASCEIGPMAGTSMSTPVVAGVAAMIRQYFVQVRVFVVVVAPRRLVRLNRGVDVFNPYTVVPQTPPSVRLDFAYPKGWYPSGIATPSDMFNPSNALVKAVIVSSGTAMASYDGSAGSTVRLRLP